MDTSPTFVELSKLLDIKPSSKRFRIWLKIHLATRYRESLPLNTSLDTIPDQYLEKFISDKEITADQITELRDDNLIPEQNFSWIGNNQRQNTWILRHILSKYNHSIYGSTSVQSRNRTIAIIDTLKIDLQSKINFVKELSQAWAFQKETDKIFDWFKKDDQENKYAIAQDFSRKKSTNMEVFSIPPLVDISFSNHDELLIFFDGHYLSLSEKRHWLECVKKIYSQQKYRKKLGSKKQYNFILPESTIAKLDDLANQYSLSRAEVLDILIKWELENPFHLPSRMLYHEAMTSDTEKKDA